MKRIGIFAPTLSPGLEATLKTLGEALGVAFERRPFDDDRGIDGWVVLAPDRAAISTIGQSARPCYVVVDPVDTSSLGDSSRITFADHAELDDVIRGRGITADDAVGAKALPSWLTNVVPLAFKEGAPVWAVQERGDCRHHYVALPLPELSVGEPLFAHFSGQRIACLLPLVLFVRSIAEEAGWEAPPLQAAFMFDDPNLHWTSYGFIDYDEMVGRAQAGNYHVSIATIPLDSWFVHQPASAIFKQHPRQISLLYHGNDHLSNELARSQSGEGMCRLLRQAVRRITALERRTGLEVARVMAAPHGACSETALSQMARLGFDAACVSRGSLRYHNPSAAWTRTIGMTPCDIAAGLPVVSRFGLSKNCRNDILIAALLRQPIVPMTHHQAVADGYDLLDETAAFVNSLGDVRWRDMKSISRALYYSRRQDEGTLSVKMASKCVTVPAPTGTTRVQVERSWLGASGDEPLFWRTDAADRRWIPVTRPEPIPVQPARRLSSPPAPSESPRPKHTSPHLAV